MSAPRDLTALRIAALRAPADAPINRCFGLWPSPQELETWMHTPEVSHVTTDHRRLDSRGVRIRLLLSRRTRRRLCQCGGFTAVALIAIFAPVAVLASAAVLVNVWLYGELKAQDERES